jgi:hypothetical protein
MIQRSILLAALLTAGLGGSAALAQDGNPNLGAASSPVTLDQGADAGQIREMTFEVITTAEGLQGLWERLHGNGTRVAAVPFIDFGTYQVVGAFGGQRTLGGYQVKLRSAQIGAQATELEFEIEAATAYADAIPTMLMGAPYLLVLVPADRPVTTRWRVP